MHIAWTELNGNSSGRWVGTVWTCLRASCEESPVTLATNQEFPQGIASDQTRVYWADTSAGTILSCSLGGCPDGGPTVLASTDAGSPFQVAVDESAVYWTNEVQGGAVMKVAKP